MTVISTPRRLTSLLIGALFMLPVAGCDSGHDDEGASETVLPPLPVRVVEVEKRRPLRQVEVMATVAAAEQASVAAKISGNIIELPVSLGTSVDRGDLLVRLDARQISAQLNQAQAQLEQAERNLNRERNLLQKNAATPETVKTLEERRRIAAAALEEARTMLDYATIEAPFAGVVTAKAANVGDLATPGKTLLRLENAASLQIEADIPEALVLGLRVGDELPVAIAAAGIETTGEIIEIAPAADPRSRSAPIKLRVPSHPQLRSGQFARVSLPGTAGTAIMVPAAALHPFGQLDRLFIVDDNTARLQLVRTGLRQGDLVEILSGVNAGDRVVISDPAELRDGRSVSVQ